MERVFVVRRSAFFDGIWPQGFVAMREDEGRTLLARMSDAGFFVDRPAAEDDPSLKQLIPYCVVTREDEILCVHRKAAQSEARLHGLLSLGLGGHINPEDVAGASGPELFRRALERELEEELHVPGLADRPAVFLGLLNDDSNAVGSVHAGLVYRMDTTSCGHGESDYGNVRIREISKMGGGFRSLAELGSLWQDPNRFETWSQRLLEARSAILTGSGDRFQGSRPRPTDRSEESEHG